MENNPTKARARATKKKVYWDLLKTALHTDRPVLAQMVVTRRCNLSCGYCFEYDKVSKPVDFDILKSRIDHFKRLKVVFVTLNGGEPLLHPQIVDLVAYITASGMIPMMNSNGRVLKPELIKKLNAAGLYGIQLSCDALDDNDVTQKSMRRLKPKLAMLSAHAEFIVRVNGVLGSGPPEEMLEVAQVVTSFDFDFQCSLRRDSTGAAMSLTPEALGVYMEIRKMRGRLPAALNDNFQLPLAMGEDLHWKCRSGARHFEVDENGLVQLCQPRTGVLGKPLSAYTAEDIREQFYTEKPCAKRCPVAYAHLGSRMDKFRSQDLKAPWQISA